MKHVINLFYVLLTITIPVLLVLFAVGVLLTPLYIQIEYRLPGFPEDPYGFTTEERLYWANITRKYLVENKNLDYLAEQDLEEDTPLYNTRELRHLYDVKLVIRSSALVFFGALVYSGIMIYWSRKSDRLHRLKVAISGGGWLTVLIIISILIYLILNFNSLFVTFHRIFFEGDTWLFRYSDTLIRLFPIRFWRDAFIWIGLMTLGLGFGIGYFVKD